MKKRIFVILGIFLFTNLVFAIEDNSSIIEQNELLEKEYDFDVVVIDPGHGGKDVGANTKDGLYEKNVTLDIARKLKTLIEKKLAVKVYLTRNDDSFVSLRARTQFANKMDADVFLSIHANASDLLSISGCETFFFEKDASDEQARLLAELENKGGLSKDSPEDALEFILMDMAKSELITLSYNFADVIQKEYVNSLKSRDRGVKQAPFTVLEGAGMPAVLTEIGFLSSKNDGSRLKDSEYLNKITQALYNSIKRYKEITDIKNGKMTREKDTNTK